MKLKFKYEYDIDAKFYVILEFMLTTLDQLQKNNVLKMTKLPFFYERRINISKWNNSIWKNLRMPKMND